MVRTTILPLMLAVPFLLSAGAQAGSGAHWPLDPPLLSHFSHRGRIGVQVEGMTPELRSYFHAPEDHGLLVARVEPDRPAARAGLRVGDVILSADGEPLQKPFDLVRTVAAAPVGEVIEFEVVRDGKERKLRIEPEGEPSLWADPERFGIWFEEKLHRGGRNLRERIEELEKRLEELEDRLEERERGTGETARET
jgi:membrane-associated protease RseP (regulator of RpoE activity)